MSFYLVRSHWQSNTFVGMENYKQSLLTGHQHCSPPFPRAASVQKSWDVPAMSNLWLSFLPQKMKIKLIFFGKVIVMTDRAPAFHSAWLHTEPSPDLQMCSSILVLAQVDRPEVSTVIVYLISASFLCWGLVQQLNTWENNCETLTGPYC